MTLGYLRWISLKGRWGYDDESDLLHSFEDIIEQIEESDRGENSSFICGVCGEHVREYTYNEEKDVDECNDCK